MFTQRSPTRPPSQRGRVASFVLVVTVMAALSVSCVAAQVVPSTATSRAGTWNLLSQAYSQRDKMFLACSATDMYFFGGRERDRNVRSMSHFNVSAQVFSNVFAVGDIRPLFSGASAISATDPNVLVLFGGNTGALTVTNDIQMFHRSKMEWTRIARDGSPDAWPASRSKHGFVHIASRNVLWIWAGTSTAFLLSDAWELDLATFVWTRVHSGMSADTPPAVFDPCCAHHAATNATFCYGGTSTLEDRAEVWRFDHRLRAWSTASTLGVIVTEDLDNSDPDKLQTPKRRVAMCAMLGDRFLVFGGFSSTLSFILPDKNLYTYDVVSGLWSVTAQAAQGRDSGAMCVAGGAVYLAGGTGAAKKDRVNDLWRLNAAAMKFELLSESQAFPQPHAGHNSVMIGSVMFVFFGRLAADPPFLNDVWKFDVIKKKWTKVAVASGSPIPSGRHGAMACRRGTSVFFYGGVTASGITDELWTFETESNVWVLEQQTNSPGPRANGGLVSPLGPNLGTTRLLLFGGRNAVATLNDFFVLHLVTKTWRSVSVRPADGSPANAANVPSPRISFGVEEDVGTQSFLIVGGLGKSALMDRWNISGLTVPAHGEAYILAEMLKSVVPVGDTTRAYVRGEMSTARSGRHMYICGGSISSSFAAADEDQCYHYDSMTGLHTRLPVHRAAVTAVSEGTAVYFGSTIFFFGGQVATNGQKRDDVSNELRWWKFDAQELCPTFAGLLGAESDATPQQLRDDKCVHCSPGTRNPLNPSTPFSDCTAVPSGRYNRWAYGEGDQCPAGSYSVIPGAQSSLFCLLCPVGTFNNVSGAPSCVPCGPSNYCTQLGSTKNESTTSRSQGLTDEVTQPLDLPPSQYPWWVFVLLPSIAFGLLLVVLIFVGIVSHSRKRRRDSIIPLFWQGVLKNVFDECAMPGYGLDEVTVYNALTHQSLEWVPPRLDPTLVSDTFRELDSDGSGYADFEEFLMVVTELIVREIIPAIPDSEYAIRLGNNRSLLLGGGPFFWIARLSISGFDQYVEQHRIGKMGDPVRIVRTASGGSLSLVYYALAAVLVVLLFSQFTYDNIIESTGTLPPALNTRSNGTFGVDFELSVTIAAAFSPPEGTVATPSNGAEVRSIEEACLDGPATGNSRDGDCKGNESNPDAAPVRIDRLTRQSNITKCSYDHAAGRCTITFICKHCTVAQGGRSLLSFTFHDSLSTSSIDVFMQTDAGSTTRDVINGVRHSTWRAQGRPVAGSKAFKGKPASVFSASLTPIRFESPERSYSANIVKRSGYILGEPSVTIGNTVDTSNANQHFGVSVDIALTAPEIVYVIKRSSRQDAINLVTGILGAVSGLSAFLVAISKFLDERSQDAREAEFRKITDEREKARQSKTPQDSEPPRDACDAVVPFAAEGGVSPPKKKDANFKQIRALLEPLMREHVPYRVALAHLTLVRACLNMDDDELDRSMDKMASLVEQK